MKADGVDTAASRLTLAQYTVAKEVSKLGVDEQTAGKPQEIAELHSKLWALAADDAEALRGSTAQMRTPEDAQRYIGELHAKLGFNKLGIDESPGLMNITEGVLSGIGQMQPAIPETLPSHPAEDPDFLGDLPVRLGATFPILSEGEPQPGQVNIDAIVPPEAKKDGFRLSDGARQMIRDGVNPRTFLQPGGLVAAEVVAFYADIQAGSVVHDVGGGEGGTAVHYANNFGADVTVSDINPQFTAMALLAAKQGSADVTVERKGFTELSIEPNSLDAVTFNQVDFYWNEGLDKAFEEVHTGLKEGGKVAMASYNMGEKPAGVSDGQWAEAQAKWNEAMKWGDADAQVTTTAQIVELLEGAGFDPDKIRVIDASEMYGTVHDAVAHNQAELGMNDPWLASHRELQRDVGGMGVIIVAEK